MFKFYGVVEMETKIIKITTPSNYEVSMRTVKKRVTKKNVIRYLPTELVVEDVVRGDYPNQKHLPRIGYIANGKEGSAYCKSSLDDLLASAVYEERTAKEDTSKRDAFKSIVTILAEVEEAVQSVKDKMPYYNEYK
ncbi:hypothetical protein [Brochothrix phage BtpYZU04]